MDEQIVIVVQARTSSTRLPGKVLKPLGGVPSIVRMMERVARTRTPHRRLVATSDHESDDRLAEVCVRAGLEVVRGPLYDVLARFRRAVPDGFEVVVRLTGDCPLVDPEVVDRHIEVFLGERPWAEYVSNAVVRTQPKGLDVEVVSADLLFRADRDAKSTYDREHVLPWVRRRARIVPVTQEVDLSDLRWTLDTAEDYEAIHRIYDALYATRPDFGRRDVYRLLLERPELIHVSPDGTIAEEVRGEVQERIAAHLVELDSRE